jgi:dipeptidase D
MINLDSEAIGVITAGCAGGLRSDLTLSPARVPFFGTALRVSVKGLMGGHSGCDIHTGRANANRLMGRLLAPLGGAITLASLSGGSKDNAIPRECEAVISALDARAAERQIMQIAQDIRKELVAEDKGFCVTVEEISAPDTMLSCEASARAIALLTCTENGVLAMNKDERGLVEWSRNLGVIRTDGETGEMKFVFSSRSATESLLDASIAALDAMAAVCGCTTRHHSRYPGWSYAPASELRRLYSEAYRDVTGKEARVEVIHAGLECGIIYSKLPDMDIISIGPDLYDIHSPKERLSLSSVELLWRTLVRLMELL